MDDYAFARWKRYGHGRVYVKDSSGNGLGFLDLKSGEYVLEDGVVHESVMRATEIWLASQGLTASAVSAEEPAALMPSLSNNERDNTEAAEPPWIDLAANLPGQGVRQLAAAEWIAAKERSTFVATVNRYVFDNHTDERAWRKGAEGEEFIGAKLNKLRAKGWYVLHSVPVGTGESDIDHIVIGPGGVFTVNSKNHAGKKIWVAKYQMRINGQPVPYLRNSRHEAARAKRLLEERVDFEVPVLGCVVVLTGTIVPEVKYKDMPEDVRVLDKWDVPRWFRKRPAALTPEQIEEIFEVARRSTTWVN